MLVLSEQFLTGWKEDNRIVATWVTALFLVVLNPVLYFAMRPQTCRFYDLGDFARLEGIYENGGIPAYEKTKADLEQQVKAALLFAKDSENYHSARNIAVFLFPQSLPKSDFERDPALAWEPIRNLIEKNPATSWSFELYREMEFSILDYEGAKSFNDLSEHAKTMLSLYRTISRPEET